MALYAVKVLAAVFLLNAKCGQSECRRLRRSLLCGGGGGEASVCSADSTSAVHLSGFYYSGYDGVWTDSGIIMDDVPVFSRDTIYGTRYLHRHRFASGDSGWCIGRYGDRNMCYMWKLGEDMFGNCDYYYLCDDWHRVSGGVWTSTPSHQESIVCTTASADTSAQNSFTGNIDEGEAHEATDYDSKSFDEFIPTILGAAAGVAVVGAIMALVVVMMRKKTAAKETEIVVCDAVHVPNASAMTADAPNEEAVAEDPVEKTTSSERGDGAEVMTAAELEE